MGYFENGVVFSDFAFNCGAPIGWHRSINDGYSWQPISLPTTSELANKLAYLGNGVALMPVTGLLDGSVYRTSDSGSSWSVISNGLFGFKQTIISIGVNQAAAIGNNLKNSHNLYLTTDGGITLAKIGQPCRYVASTHGLWLFISGNPFYLAGSLVIRRASEGPFRIQVTVCLSWEQRSFCGFLQALQPSYCLRPRSTFFFQANKILQRGSSCSRWCPLLSWKS